MYLKRLDLKGFKSFAALTTIHFEPGINVVVGPNGCGKSNVVDAVRWVLGENNIRNLRGQKGQDIIFCGTDSHRAHGMATAEILIDNADRFLPLEYQELNLSRKIFRSGESEFFINRTQVRMKDIHELLAGTGLGKKGYAIISQGELEQLLQAHSLERRLILEEAAGIIKYRQECEEVKRRLEGTAQDLTRLTDLLFELGQREKELQAKAEKAKRYLEDKAELDRLDRILLALAISRLEREHRTCQLDLSENSTVLKRQEEACLTYEEQLSKQETGLEALRLQEQGLLKDKFDAQAYITELRSGQELTKERITNYQERIKVAQADIVKYTALLAKMEQDLRTNRADYEQQQALRQELEEQYRQISQKTVSLQKLISGESELFEASKADLFAASRAQSQLKNTIREEEGKLRKNQEKRARLQIQQEQLQQQIKQLHEDKAQSLKEKATVQLRLKELLGQIEQAQKKQANTAQHLLQVEKDLHQHRQELGQQNSRLTTLKRMRENLSGYASGVRAVMAWSKKEELPGILGIVGELFKVVPGLETAIEVAAGRSLQNIVVPSNRDASRAIERLRVKKAGRVTFLPLDSLRYRQVPEEFVKKALDIEGVVGKADRLIDCEPQYRPVAEFLLGRVLLVENLNSGIRAFEELSYPFTMVSLGGEIIRASGAMTGGTSAEQGSGHLQRLAEERQIERRVLELQEEVHQLEETHALVRSEGQEANQKTQVLKNQQVEGSLKNEWLNNQLQVLNRDLLESQQHNAQLAGETERLEAAAGGIQKNLAALHHEVNLGEKCQDSDALQLEKQREALTQMQQKLEIYRERSNSFQGQIEMRKKEQEKSHKNLLQFENVQKSYQESHQAAQELLLSLKKENENAAERLGELKIQSGQHASLLMHKDQELALLKDSIKEVSKNIHELREALLPLRERIQEQGPDIRRQELHLARLEVELSNHYAQWQQRYEADQWEEVDLQGFKKGQLRQMKERQGVLKEAITALGAVDTDAIAAFRDWQDKLNFMKQQYRDLEQARSALMDLLKETEQLMAKEFRQFMAQAQQSFAMTFKQMFNGGEGRLISAAGVKGLEAGVDIEVKVPGKRVQSLELLSGGERALTCIAFLFALIRLKPLPFCLLDEIDASLDETNLLRFTAFLQGMSQETQFIVITHRQTTAACGNTIYGITMAEKGISQVYTLALDGIPHKAG